MTEFLGLGVFLTAAVALTPSESSDMAFVQYGALGLCALMVFWLLKHVTKLTQENQKIAIQAVRALDRIATLWEERACLYSAKPVQNKVADEIDKE